MKITEEFEVHRPVEAVWAAFQDIPSMAQCLPGATLTGEKGNDVYLGTVSVKLGPMSPTFEGEATVTADPAARSGKIVGAGTDKRGGSRGQVVVDYRLRGTEGATAVTIEADVTLSGAAAQFGRTGVMQEISNRLIREFSQCLEAKLAAGTVEEKAQISAGEVRGVSLFFSSLLTSLRSLLQRLLRPRPR